MSKTTKAERKRWARLAKKLAAYSVTAGAGALANDAASGAVIHVDPADIVSDGSSGNILLDLDGNAVDDFELRQLNFGGTKVTAPLVGLDGGNQNRSRSYRRTSNISTAPKYPAGVAVDANSPTEITGFETPGMQFDNVFADTWGSSGFTYLSYYNAGFNLSGSTALVKAPIADRWMTSTTSFTSTGPGYLPVQFDISGQLHYGWMQMQMTGRGDGEATTADEATVTIFDWAYESTPNATILTGDIGSGGGPPGAVPEPSTFGLGVLALGALGVGALRRRRRSEAK